MNLWFKCAQNVFVMLRFIEKKLHWVLKTKIGICQIRGIAQLDQEMKIWNQALGACR